MSLLDGARAGVCTGDGPCDTTPFSASTTDNWVARTGGLPLYIRAVAKALRRKGASESEAIATAVATVKRWAAGDGHVTAATRARAAAALAEWERKKSEAHGRRAAGFVAETGSAGSLLPRGPSPKVAERIERRLAVDPAGLHAFRGRDLDHCGLCGQPATAPIHQSRRASTTRAATGVRHAGPGHKAVPTGHVAGNPVRARRAHKHAFDADADRIEPELHQAMTVLFERQRKTTLSRLRGNRGRRMLKGVRSANPPSAGQPSSQPAQPASGPVTPPALSPLPLPGSPHAPSIPVASVPDAGAVFDTGFWTGETAKAVTPILEEAQRLSLKRVDDQIGPPPPGVSSIAAAPANITARANRLAGQVTDTTYRQIQQALADGVADGESTEQLATRVQHVFDVSRARARLIARTETISALNQAALDHAINRGVVTTKEWLAHHDTRTRPTHRVADGQTVPIAQPFHVGASLMAYPGDPTAPPDEVCNCRCALLFGTAPAA